MTGIEKVVEHLKMTQAVINRLGRNSFLVKGWSMTVIVAAMLLIARHDVNNSYFVLVLVIPTLGFWILDGYFLWQERLFRKVYDDIRVQSDSDFKMNPLKHRDQPKCNWISSIFSVTLNIFYLIEIAFTVVVFFIVDAKTPPTP